MTSGRCQQAVGNPPPPTTESPAEQPHWPLWLCVDIRYLLLHGMLYAFTGSQGHPLIGQQSVRGSKLAK